MENENIDFVVAGIVEDVLTAALLQVGPTPSDSDDSDVEEDSLDITSSSCSTTIVTVKEQEASLESISAIEASFCDQGTQTDALPCPCGEFLFPPEILAKLKSDAPWLLSAFDGFHKRLSDVEGGLAANSSDIKKNEEAISKNTLNVSDNKQYLKRNNLLLSKLNDIPYKKRGVAFAEYVANKLNSLFPHLRWRGRKISADDIDTSHPLKNKNIIVVKFKSRDLKNLIYCNKRSLKCNVGISEHLSRGILDLRRKTKEAFPNKKVWTEECKVFISWGSSKRCICNQADIEEGFHRSSTPIPLSNNHASSSPLEGHVSRNVSQSLSHSSTTNNNREQLSQYEGILNVHKQWRSRRGPPNDKDDRSDDASIRSYPNMVRNPGWIRGQGSGFRGRGQFLPINRGRGTTRPYGGQGRGHFLEKRGNYKGRGGNRGGRRGNNRGRGHAAPNNFYDRVERGGYFNSLYRNTNVNY